MSLEIFEAEYNKCVKLKDYEMYFLKYRTQVDNPFVAKAKEQIEIRSRISMPIRILFFLIFLCVSGLLVYVVSLVDGTTNELAGLIGFASVIGALVCFIIGLAIFFSPAILVRIREQFI